MAKNSTLIQAPINIATAAMVSTMFATASNHDHISTSGMLDILDPDNFYFTCDLVHEGVNGNKDEFLRNELNGAWHTLVGQPIDKDHILTVDGSVGQITDASYDVIDGLSLIRIAAFVSQKFYPDVAWKLASGIITGVSMECAFEWGDQRSDKRILHGVSFVGAGLTRMPADNRSQVDNMGAEPLSVSSRRRFLLMNVAMQTALQRMAA